MPVPTSSNYPTSLDDASTLFNSYNQKTFTLNGAIDSTQTTMVVDESLSGLSPYFFLAFETGELVFVTGVNVGSYQFTMVRGVNGNNQSHSDAETMRLTVAAEIFEQLKDAIIAIETELGTTPKDTAADVAERLDNIDTLISTHDHDGVESVTINADTVDNFHAYSTATANHLLALDANGDLPTNITGDADTLDGQHGSYYLRKGTLFSVAASELTISSGAVTATPSTASIYTVDTESDAAIDDLDTISGGTNGDVIIIRPANTNRTVVIKSGTGNIYTAGNDIALFNIRHFAILRHNGTNWELAGGSCPKRREFNIILGSNVDVIGTGVIGDMVLERDIFLDAWRMYAQQSGSMVVDIWKDTWPTAPDNADTITNANEPTVSASTYGSGNCSSWGTREIASGSILRFNIDSCSTIEQATLTLSYWSL